MLVSILKKKRKICFLALIMFTYPASGFSQAVSDSETLKKLEERVWSVPDHLILEAESTAAKVIQLHPHSAAAHYLLGQVYIRKFTNNPFEMIHLRRAAELGQQAIDLRPDLDFGYVVSAQVLDIMGYTENAIKLINPKFNPAIKASWRTTFLQAKFILAQRNFQRSLDLLKTAMKMKHSQSNIITPLALAIIDRNFYGRDLINNITDWKNEFDSEEASLQLAITYTDLGDYDKSHEIYTRLTKNKQSRFYLEAKINHAILLFKHKSYLALSEKMLEKVLSSETFIREGVHAKKLLARSYLAQIYLHQKLYDKASKLLLGNIKEAENPAQWISQCYLLYKSTNSLKQFSDFIYEVKKEVSGTSMLFALHGDVLSEHLNKHDAAIISYSKAIILEPNKSQLYNGLGLAYYRKNEMRSALKNFSYASKINPSDATARYNIACVLSIMGRQQEALSFLEEAINLDPRLLTNASTDNDFNNIRGSSTFQSIVQPGSDLSQANNLPH